METGRPQTIKLLIGIYAIFIAGGFAAGIYIMQKLSGSVGIRLGLIGVVIAVIYALMLIGMLKKKQWGYDLIQVISKLALIVSGLETIFVLPRLWAPLVILAVLAFTSYKLTNSFDFRAYYNQDPIPEQLTHL